MWQTNTKVKPAAEPRTLVPPDRKTPESDHRLVVIAFKTQEEQLNFFMKPV
jgi:hypothetical protein